MCFGWKKLVLFFLKRTDKWESKGIDCWPGVADAFTCDCWQTISMETRVRDTCCTLFYVIFFSSCFVSSQLQLKFFFFFFFGAQGILAVKIHQTKLAIPSFLYLYIELFVIQFFYSFIRISEETFYNVISELKERFFSKNGDGSHFSI